MNPKVKVIEWFDDRFYKLIYQKDDKEVTDYFPSVTTKLGAVAKPFLTYWYGDLGTREAQLRSMEAADKGSRVHHAWQMYLLGGAVIYQPYKKPIYTMQQIAELEDKHKGNIAILYTQEEMYAMSKMQRWDNVVNPSLLEAEHTVYSMKNREAGTVDTILQIKEGHYAVNGKDALKLETGTYIHDLKTGKTVGNDAKMQVAAYAVMVEEMGLAKITGALITHTQAKTKSGIEGLATILLTREEIDKYYKDFRNVAAVWDSQFGSMKPKVFEIPTIITRKE